MCLVTKRRWPKIAWKPIKVYKVIFKSCVSNYRTLFQCSPVKIGSSYKESIFRILEFRNKFGNTYQINVGLHALTCRTTAEIIAKFYRTYNTVIVECEIPRFSLYWIGDNSDIVSNKLKYIKIL
jgi:hypothetical protein